MGADKDLLSVPIHSALNKPNLFMEGDREMMMMLMLVEFILIFLFLNFHSFVVAIVLWVALVPLLRYMAKRDPYMRHIFLKQLKHQKYYPAHSTPFVRSE